MKFTDHDIDDAFKDLDAKSSVGFKEEYWSEMEQLLDDKQKKKSGWLLWFLLPTFCLSMLLIFSVIFYADNGNTNNLVKNTTERKVIHVVDSSSTISINFSYCQMNFDSQDDIDKPLNNSQTAVRVSQTSIIAKDVNPSDNQNNLLTPSTSMIDNDIISMTDKQEQISEVDIQKHNIEKNIVSPELMEQSNNLDSISTDNEQDLLATVKNEELNEISNVDRIGDIVKKKNTWRMYVAGVLGIQTNLGTQKKSVSAGLFKFEYGTEKTFNHFSFSPSIGLETTFGNTYQFNNIYISYDTKRNEHEQSYNYNRMTNALINIQFGYYLGQNRRSHIELIASSTFNIYNNIVYKTFKNEELIFKNEYFNQNLGLNRIYFSGGIRYSYVIKDNLSLGVEFNSNFGTFRKKEFKKYLPTTADYQLAIRLKYLIK